MTLWDMINKTICYQDVQVFTSGDSTLLFEGTVEEAIEAYMEKNNMTGNEYVELAMRTNDGKGTERLGYHTDPGLEEVKDFGGVLNGCLGLAGESGEVLDMVKKWVFHEKELDKDHLKKEIGDVMWYVAMLCESFSFSLDEILQINVDKLKARYPKGFDINRANNRAEGDI